MYESLVEFRGTVELSRRYEAVKKETVHLVNVNESQLGLPEALLDAFCRLVEKFDPAGVSEQDVVTINLLLNCFSHVLGRRASDFESNRNFREYIRNRLAVRLAEIQMAQRRATANQQ